MKKKDETNIIMLPAKNWVGSKLQETKANDCESCDGDCANCEHAEIDLIGTMMDSFDLVLHNMSVFNQKADVINSRLELLLDYLGNVVEGKQTRSKNENTQKKL